MGMQGQPQVLDMIVDEWVNSRKNGNAGGGNLGSTGRSLVQQKAGLSGSAGVGPYNHGYGGLFGVAGLERDVISTRVHPIGLASELPSRGSVVTNPIFPYITGFNAPTGANPNGPCDDAPEAGPMMTCFQTAQFGLVSYQTRTMDISMQGRQMNRGEFLDLRVMNDPLLDTPNDITTPNVAGAPSLLSDVLQRFVEVGISFQNKLMPMLYSGNPANNTGGGGYKEFPGLDILIGTSKVDALTGTTCPTLNSDVKDFKYGRVDTAPADVNIVNTLSMMMRYLGYTADATNLGPVTWSIVMRPELWWELSAVWPCSYFTSRCMAMSNSSAVIVEASEQIKMRDDMRNNMYLLIDGIRYEVILDTGIPVESNTTQNKVTSGCFASAIYIVPRTFRNGLAATYWEYVDYQRTAMTALQQAPGGAALSYWTDGGRYLWHKQPEINWCIRWIGRVEPRVILPVPHLAGKLLNVQYCSMQNVRQPFPTDPYFVGGGVSGRYGPSLYHDWNPNPGVQG